MKHLLVAIFGIFSFSAFSQSFLQVKKSFNPENVLHVAAEIEGCHFVEPYVSSHWIMGEKRGQKAKLNVFEKPQFSPIIIEANSNEVKFTAKALKDAKINPEYKVVTLKLINCEPHAFVLFESRELELKEIFADAKLFYKGKPVYINYVVIEGLYPDGSRYTRKVNL